MLFWNLGRTWVNTGSLKYVYIEVIENETTNQVNYIEYAMGHDNGGLVWLNRYQFEKILQTDKNVRERFDLTLDLFCIMILETQQMLELALTRKGN